MSDPADFYDEDFPPDEWEQADWEEECGLMPDGTCLLAGTEHCDWDCGALNAQRIEDMKARKSDPTKNTA